MNNYSVLAGLSFCLFLTTTSNSMEKNSLIEENKWEPTIFYQACQEGLWEQFCNLLETDQANINEVDTNNGWNPLHIATIKGHCEIVKGLIEKFGNVNQRDNSGCTPLHLTAVTGNSAIAALLLSNGADRTIASFQGTTPLEEADANGLVEIVILLQTTEVQNSYSLENGILYNDNYSAGSSEKAAFIIESLYSVDKNNEHSLINMHEQEGSSTTSTSTQTKKTVTFQKETTTSQLSPSNLRSHYKQSKPKPQPISHPIEQPKVPYTQELIVPTSTGGKKTVIVTTVPY